MEIKSFLEGNQDLAEALSALPFIEELAETDYGSISLNKFINIMGSNGFEAESLRRSLQQAVESLIVNNETPPEDPFSISLDDWKPLIGDERSNEIITAISNLNKEIDLVAGGTSSSNHKAARAVGATVVAAAGAATLTFAAKKLKENKNNIEKAIEIQAKIEAGTFVEGRDIPATWTKDWQNAKKEVERKAKDAGVSLEEYERREFSDEFFRVGGLKGLEKPVISAIDKNFPITILPEDLAKAKTAIKKELKTQADNFAETRFGMEFTLHGAKEEIKSIADQMIEEKVLTPRISTRKVDELATKATEAVLESSIKTLYEKDKDLIKLISPENLRRFVKGKISESDLIEKIKTNSAFARASKRAIQFTEQEKEMLLKVPTEFKNNIQGIKIDLKKSMKSALDDKFKETINERAGLAFKEDFNKEDFNLETLMPNLIDDHTKIKKISAKITALSESDIISDKFGGAITKDIVKGAVQDVRTEVRKELRDVIEKDLVSAGEMRMEKELDIETGKVSEKIEKEYIDKFETLIDDTAKTDVAKVAKAFEKDIANQLVNDLSDFGGGKIIDKME